MFGIDLASISTSVVVGSDTQVAISVVVDSGAPHPVGLSVTGVPAGVSSSFATVSATAPFASALALDASSSAAPGTYQITIRGRSGTEVKSASLELTVKAATTAAPVTYTETVSSTPSQGGTTSPAPGTYTFESGQTLTLTALPSTGWSLDYWLVDGIQAGNGTKFSFVAASDVTIEAVFFQAAAQQAAALASVSFTSSGASGAQIMVDGTTYALPTSFEWAVGSSHKVSAETVITGGGDAKAVVAGWQGAVNSSSPTATFTVNKDMTFIASYQTEYLVSFAFAGSTGSPLLAQNATIYGPQGLVTITSTNSSAWLVGGATYTPLGGTAGGVVVPVVPGTGSFTADGPTTITIPLSTYPVSIKVVDMFGQPISGANVTLVTSGQQTFTQLTGENGVATFSEVPMGWFDATYHYLGLSGSLSSDATGAHTETVGVALSYPVFTVAAVFTVLVALSAFATWRRNKRVEETFDGYSDY